MKVTSGLSFYESKNSTGFAGLNNFSFKMDKMGMTEKKFIEICNRQLSDKEKRCKANYIIPTGLGKSVSLAYIKKIIQDVKTKNSRKWLPGRGIYVETNST